MVLVVSIAACSGRDGGLPSPSSTSSTSPEATTTTIDYSKVPLEPVAGRTTTTFVTSGSVTLTGRVDGPDGLVPGAMVFVDRLVGDGVQSFRVDTIEDGTWKLEKLPGGRYRLRAAVPPRLTTAEPVIFYVEDGATRDTSLVLQVHDGLAGVAGTTPAAPVVGDSLNLAVQIVERFVDETGTGRSRPVAGVRVEVQQIGWSEIDDPVGVTDGDGFVVFAYRCERVGEVDARAIVGSDRPDPEPDDSDPDDNGEGETPPDDEDGDEGAQQDGDSGGRARQIVPLDVPDCAPRPTTTTTESGAGSTSTTEG